MSRICDVVVAGGSIAGLTFASEAAKRGLSVIVAEEHPEVGEPEKCDGLVSLRGLRKYGYPPEGAAVQDQITSAILHSPSGKRLAVNASALDVVVLDRSAYDKQVEAAASAAGAKVTTGSRVGDVHEKVDSVSVKVGTEDVQAKFLVDATGPASSPRRGILPAAKYEVEGDWIRQHVVEVFLDAEKYPGYFAWVIPFGKHRAKVGAAGYGVSPFRALDRFLEGRSTTVLRKVSAPIYVGGPAQSFVRGRRVYVGESAGQVKPTTAGGIMTSVAGGVAAAKWVSSSILEGRPPLVERYQKEWEGDFLKEMKAMMRLRGVFEKLSNHDLEAVFSVLAAPRLVKKLSQTDFDFHASALLGSLGMPGLLRVARVVASAEVRSILLER
ncbi:MAG: NAD(P)/FAD-dependent oxidoreductase [Nitrososphaerota archaeon]|jgi:geranylgeranyl reductase family protein|nr:NAD(P)/FAD-dependent oxidoreductase [Nitrososphaerota archaeon]MDG6968803.1 NAD(P)/FAD-dependent oxidoreductase [Nitrososphaerota archaeon]MDG6973556.1 NAD(P)/FAD-dependent oxidoreductase [Nitrososphaerota archaeon]MDG6976665.1 NAD(P)/FAD-dependent oxidoreductase [Nitrososphaerota archaeon]MDG7015628.1 NAD(P)/FAD-dependent oxidoreductase [Nitrososphaerota archaeon]